MCGIVGFYDRSGTAKFNDLDKMVKTLQHRGPDDCGHTFIKSDHFYVGLGHRRLSVLDLSINGKQPMSYDHLEITYNGEVYNYRELRSELINLGYKFLSDSDTEVILKAFHAWGIDSVERLNGMFSFVIFDKKVSKFYLVRDRAGVKPLYYYYKEGVFLFSSELRAFHANASFKKVLSNKGLSLYFQFGYVPEPYSIFENTFKVRAGHYLEFNLLTNELNEQQYWNLLDFYEKPKLEISLHAAQKKVEELIISSCKYRTISDIPVGIFLSGGYDSSLVSSVLSNNNSPLKTFTIGFEDDALDESVDARLIANHLNLKNKSSHMTSADLVMLTKAMGNVFDEPFGDGSSIPTMHLSDFAKKQVGVALSADGGDEIFAGYSKYKTLLTIYNTFNFIPFSMRSLISRCLKKINPSKIPILNKKYNFYTRYTKVIEILGAANLSQALKSITTINTNHEVRSLIGSKFLDAKTNFDISTEKIENQLDKILFTDYKTYLTDNILVKVDRATMSSSLEGRNPLLDYRIIEYVSQLPQNYKLTKNNTKIILKEIVHSKIPKYLMDRPKKGFGVPMKDWLSEDLRSIVLDYLNEDRLKNAGILNCEEVLRIRDSFFKDKWVNPHKLWLILIFQIWYEEWFQK